MRRGRPRTAPRREGSALSTGVRDIPVRLSLPWLLSLGFCSGSHPHDEWGRPESTGAVSFIRNVISGFGWDYTELRFRLHPAVGQFRERIRRGPSKTRDDNHTEETCLGRETGRRRPDVAG